MASLWKMIVAALALTSQSAAACAPPIAGPWYGGPLVPADASYVLAVPYLNMSEGITVAGNLYIGDDFDVDITVPFIEVVGNGSLEAGSELCPRRHRLDVRLTSSGAPPRGNVSHKALRVLDNATVTMRGSKGMSGDAWVRLGGTAPAGSTVLSLDRDVPTWAPGDEIVLSGTDFSPAQNEVRTLASVSGNRVTLTRPLAYTHFGEVTSGVDERGEVALLTRDITIQDADPRNGSFWGMHTMFASRRPAGVDVRGVRFLHGGQPLIGKYPVHFHMQNQAGGLLQGCVADGSNFRGVVIHGSSNVVLRDNVVYDVQGHGYFFEDGSETNCTLAGNLGLGANMVTRPGDRVGSEVAEAQLSVFWLENPANYLYDNAAGSSKGTAYWYNTRLRARGLSALDPTIPKVQPSGTPLGAFRGNSAHGVRTCLQLETSPTDNLDVPTVYPSAPLSNWNPIDRTGARVLANFDGLTCHHARRNGLWARLTSLNLTRCAFADMPEAIQVASSGQQPSADAAFVDGCLMVGRTANLGNATMTDDWQVPNRGPGGAGSCPGGSVCCSSCFRIYDGPVAARNMTFRNIRAFDCSAQTPGGGVMSRSYNVFQMSAGNSVAGARYENVDYYSVFHDVQADGGKHSGFYDADGSTSGIPGATVLPSWGYYNYRCKPVADRGSRSIACPQDYANLQVVVPGAKTLNVTRLTDDTGASVDARTMTLTTPQDVMFMGLASPGAAYALSPSAIAAGGQVRVQMVTMARGAKVRFAMCLPPGVGVANVTAGLSRRQAATDATSAYLLQPSASASAAWSSPASSYYLADDGTLYFSVVQTFATQADRAGRPGCPAQGCSRVQITLVPLRLPPLPPYPGNTTNATVPPPPSGISYPPVPPYPRSRCSLTPLTPRVPDDDAWLAIHA